MPFVHSFFEIDEFSRRATEVPALDADSLTFLINIIVIRGSVENPCFMSDCIVVLVNVEFDQIPIGVPAPLLTLTLIVYVMGEGFGFPIRVPRSPISLPFSAEVVEAFRPDIPSGIPLVFFPNFMAVPKKSQSLQASVRMVFVPNATHRFALVMKFVSPRLELGVREQNKTWARSKCCEPTQ